MDMIDTAMIAKRMLFTRFYSRRTTMAMKRCPVCGERYSDTYKNCPFCEEEEYWEEEQEPARRPILREGVRSPGAEAPMAL